jgi:hypothetical protein
VNYYFMPRVPGLKGAVTLANFPAADDGPPWSAGMIAYAAWSDGTAWQVRDLGVLHAGAAVTCTEDDLPSDMPDEATAFLFFHHDRLAPRHDALPAGNFMNTQPAWRANIGLVGPSSSVSYQGEYTWNLVPVEKGTLLSYTSFVETGPDLRTQFLMVNLRRDPAIEPCRVRFVCARTRSVLGNAVVRRNRCTVVPMDDIEVAPGGVLVTVSPDLTGVPLYLTHTRDFRQMSFEHTHPPSELMVFGARNEVQRDIKSWWLAETGF